MDKKVFINRRQGDDRRQELDLCEGLDVDIYHRKRRKKSDRRTEDRSLDEDYSAFINAQNTDDKHPTNSGYH
ncbi:MAG: hypothetical protein KTR20_03560 [Cellvibrionaceae bacterium]|nr:hypothetical protein [Cellvibrionaceae bacterium]